MYRYCYWLGWGIWLIRTIREDLEVINIYKDQVERAKRLYDFEALNGSITKGKSNVYGALGEILVADHFFDVGVDFSSTKDYDMIIKGYKVDVKTKRTTVEPKEFYFCSISNWNTKQECDFYFFVRVMEDFTKGFLLGYIRKKEFYEKAVFKKKGDEDTNGFLFKDNCYNVEISKLKKFTKIF